MASKSYEKLIDDIGNLSVFDLADLVKALEERFGVSAAMPMASAPVAVAAEAVAAPEEKLQYKVTLTEVGSDKIKVIKALRQVVQGLSLSDAKQKVESAPQVIAEAAPKDEAAKIKKELEAAGAKVVLS